MNDQEKVSRVHHQHIGEIMMARHTGKTIIRTLAKIPSCATEISYDEMDIGALCEHPERFSIKKEPEFLYVNVMQNSKENLPYTESWHTWEEAKKVAKNLTESGCKVLIEAHPIALPE